MPQSPKPPIMMVAPSGMTATASSADASTLFMTSIIGKDDFARARLVEELP